MAIIQYRNFKDQLLIIEPDLIGIKDRGINQNNAKIDFQLVNFHPMVRNNWETSDSLRGVLGAYYVSYKSSKGDTLWNYASAFDRLRSGLPAGSAFDHGPEGVGHLREQLQGDNLGTNLIFDVLYDESTTTPFILLSRDLLGWDSYNVAGSADSNWFRNNFLEYVEGETGIVDTATGIPYLYPGVLKQDNFLNITHPDHTSVHYLISVNRKIRQSSGVSTDIEPIYNFFVNSNPDFEEVIAQPEIDEYLIPNAYYLQLELRNTSSTLLDPYHNDVITFSPAGTIVPWMNYSDIFVMGTNRIFLGTEKTAGVYYNLYSNNIKITADNPQARDLVKRSNKDLGVLYSDLGVLNQDSINPDIIPFYNKITIGYDAEQYADTVTSTSLLQTLLNDPNTKDFIDILQWSSIIKYKETHSSEGFTSRELTRTNSDNPSSFGLEFNRAKQYPVLYNFLELFSALYGGAMSNLQGIKPNASSTTAGLGIKFLRDYFGKTTSELDLETNSIVETALTISTNSFLDSFKRTIEQVFLNLPCHTETLLYIIEKFRVSDSILDQEPVQTFFISPKFSPDEIPLDTVYYDAQIKYNQKYAYKIKKVVLVFGNEYSYTANQVDGVNQTSKIFFKNTPSIKAIVVPYTFEALQVSVIDKPPVSPNISFYPMKGVNNTIKILLNSNTGRYFDWPVAIIDSDQTFFEEEYFSQTGNSLTFDEIRAANKKIQFLSDDPIDKYHLFKRNKKPTSYQDFNEFIEINPEVGVAGFFEDSILPNRKYYYCARSVDVHNNISNPTYIFEIEIIDNNGQIYLKQDIFTFKQEKLTQIKNGRRFVYIEPSLQQSVLDTEIAAPANVDDNPEDGILGVSGVESVWEKTFKVRVTSKKTGKQLDLNLTFKNSGVTNPS